MEAILLAGGKGERLGEAAAGRPKPLVRVGGRPLAAYQVARLVEAGVGRVIVSCSAGLEAAFEADLSGLGAEVVAVGEPEPLGRGGGLRFAAERREEAGPVYAVNGDELLDLDFVALLDRHREAGAAATVTVAPLEAVQGADAAVVVTEWDELRTLARPEFRDAMRHPLIVDGRNLLDPEEARAAGFVYEGIGRAASAPFAALPETPEPEHTREAQA